MQDRITLGSDPSVIMDSEGAVSQALLLLNFKVKNLGGKGQRSLVYNHICSGGRMAQTIFFRKIGLVVGKDPPTISKEIKCHFTIAEKG